MKVTLWAYGMGVFAALALVILVANIAYWMSH